MPTLHFLVIKISYDPETDSLAITLRQERIKESLIIFTTTDKSFWKGIVGGRIKHKDYGIGKVINVEFNENPFNVYIMVRFEHQVESIFHGKRDILEFTHVAFIEQKIIVDRGNWIKEICNERSINNLIHFTRVKNLRSILKKGLLGRNHLKTLPQEDIPEINDEKRLDGYPQAISLSISFPNYKMFYKYKEKSKTHNVRWACLLIDAAVLWNLDCAFCQTNAASILMKKIPLNERKKVDAFLKMFDDFNQIKREQLKIPQNYPTDPQAEVLVFEPIEPKYITSVHFDYKDTYQRWVDANGLDYQQQIVLNGKYFKPRNDYKNWIGDNL